MIIGDGFAEVYEKWLREIFYNYDFISSPRNMEIKEKINLSMSITNIYKNLFINDVRSVNLKYLAGELVWYFTGDNKLDFIYQYSKFWKQIVNSDNTLNSAYGYLLFKEKNEYEITQWEWAKQCLIRDKNTRQSVLHFNKPHHQFLNNKDFVCTMYGIFLIRNNRLHFSVFMRSSDAILGITYDLPFFLLLHQIMLLELKIIYDDLMPGSFYFLANSAHIYQKHYKLVEEMLKHSFKSAEMPKIEINPILNYNLELVKKKEYDDNDLWLRWLQRQL